MITKTVIAHGASIPYFLQKSKNEIIRVLSASTQKELNHHDLIIHVDYASKLLPYTDFAKENAWKRFHEKAAEFAKVWREFDQVLAEQDTLPETYEELSGQMEAFLQKRGKESDKRYVEGLLIHRACEVKREFAEDIEYLVKAHQDEEYSLDKEFGEHYPELAPALLGTKDAEQGEEIDIISFDTQYCIEVAEHFRKRMLQYPQKDFDTQIKKSFQQVENFHRVLDLSIIAERCNERIITALKQV